MTDAAALMHALHMAEAERHVREAQARVAEQVALVERLRRRGADIEAAEMLLARMREVLADFQLHLLQLTDEASDGPRWVHAPPDRRGWTRDELSGDIEVDSTPPRRG